LSATGSFGWNPESGEIFWSDETFRISEYEPRSKPSIEMIIKRVHPEDVALVERVIERARIDRQDFELEHRLEMPDGSVKHLHVVARGFLSDSGEMQFVGAVTDVTAAKNAQDRLNAAQAQVARAMRLSVVGYPQLACAFLVALMMTISFFSVHKRKSPWRQSRA
jgi:hypothetical protein